MRSDLPLALPLAFFSFVGLLFVLAALHDISRANETGYVVEYTAITIGAGLLVLINCVALKWLSSKGKAAWLFALAAVLALLDTGAFISAISPKYGNDLLVGCVFLAATVPVFGFVVYRLVRMLAQEPAPKAGVGSIRI